MAEMELLNKNGVTMEYGRDADGKIINITKYARKKLNGKRDYCKLTSIILNCVFTFILILLIVFISYFDTSSESSCRITASELSHLLSEESTPLNASTAHNNSTDEYDFTGYYELIDTKNFDGFMKELGVNYFVRTVVNKIKSNYEISKDGEYYILKTISSFRTTEIKFKPGEPFREKRGDGVEITANVTIAGNKWIHKQYGDKEVTIVREFDGDLIKATFVVNDVVSVRTYKKKSDASVR